MHKAMNAAIQGGKAGLAVKVKTKIKVKPTGSGRAIGSKR